MVTDSGVLTYYTSQGIRTMPHTPRRVYIYEQEQSKSRAVTQVYPEVTGSGRTLHENVEGIECTLHDWSHPSLDTTHVGGYAT